MTAHTPTAGARPQGRYDTTTIVLHWLTALLVVVMFALPHIWQQFERRTPPRLWLIDLHFSLGITLAGLLLVRILWRAALGGRLPHAGPGAAGLASRIVHLAFYILLRTRRRACRGGTAAPLCPPRRLAAAHDAEAVRAGAGGSAWTSADGWRGRLEFGWGLGVKSADNSYRVRDDEPLGLAR